MPDLPMRHRPAAPRKRGSKSKFANWYSDRRWRAKREAHLQREPVCRYCLEREGRYVPADVVDHIVPHRGDRQLFWYGELQSLCHRCHSGIKQRQDHATGGGSL